MSLQDIEQPRVVAQNVVETTRTAYDSLRKSERKVADLLLAEPRRVLGATLAQVADMADVSQMTVVRFCAGIGCATFREFKLQLAHTLAVGVPASYSVLSEDDTVEAISEKIFDYTMASLDWARSHLDARAIERAIELLRNARSIEFFGFGASAIVAADAQQKFPLFGVPCGAQPDAHQQIMVAAMMRPGDVAVAISNTGRTISVIETARAARQAGAKVIAVTGSASPLAAECDVALIVETLDNTNIYTPTISRIAALVVMDILSTAVALRHSDSDKERFRDMKQRLNAFRFGGES
jgi:RpiR family carbohydrate utilization transcriptional regulator